MQCAVVACFLLVIVSFGDASLSPEEELEQLFQVDPEAREKRDLYDTAISRHLTKAKLDLKDRLKHEGYWYLKGKSMRKKLRNRPFQKVQRFLKTNRYAKKFFYRERILESCIHGIIRQFRGKLSRKTVLDKIKGRRFPGYGGGGGGVDPGDSCPFKLDKPCRKISTVNTYRTIDASCNNLKHPLWGKSFIPFTRDVPSQYDDGVSTPRNTGRNNKPLPSPRKVVTTIHVDTHVPDNVNSFALMTWGQVLDHDTDLTAISKFKNPKTDETEDIICGDDGCDDTVKECFPIPVNPLMDPVFKDIKCLEFVRAQGVPNRKCTMGPRQQLNQITSYLDANFVYGSTDELAANLREKKRIGYKVILGAKLRSQPHPFDPKRKPLLPTQDAGMCVDTDATIRCFLAGDVRANEQNHLTVTHTIFMREHNRIVDALKKVNPHWGEERLYQEARRVLIAEVQHIDYNEYLPLVIGDKNLDRFDLRLMKKGYFTGYDNQVDVSTSNAFATASFRFAHNTVPSLVKRPNFTTLKMSETFFRPRPLYNIDQGGLDAYIRGFVTQKSEENDRFFSEEITNKLFSDNPPDGLGTDLASININRGRDHGIPGFNAWRRFCGLKPIADFTQLGKLLKNPWVAKLYGNIFGHVDDIDFYSVGLVEPQVDGSLLGETFLCHIAKQFRKYRFGDRFWYEGKVRGTKSFTEAQLAELRKVTFARVLCNNGDNIQNMQKYVMKIPSKTNPVMDCAWLPDIDFSKWKERRTGFGGY